MVHTNETEILLESIKEFNEVLLGDEARKQALWDIQRDECINYLLEEVIEEEGKEE